MYIIRTLQYMIAECDLFQSHLLYDSGHDTWRFVFAFLPGKPRLFFNVTWRKNCQWHWKIANTPMWEMLKDTMDREVCGRILNLSIQSSDFGFLPIGQLVWLVEIPYA